MGKDSGIQWTTHTFNPWVGCQRVSPGCEHCYAESYDKRVGGAVIDKATGEKALRWGPKAPRVRTAPANWKKPFAWNKAAYVAGERHRVFCSSLADVFEDRPELVLWRQQLFEVIRLTPYLDWLLLTKRPENIIPQLRELEALALTLPVSPDRSGMWGFVHAWLDHRPPANVWIGTTVEDQQRANERIPHLVGVPAVNRFLSCEPLLEAVNLDQWLDEYRTGFVLRLDWVIIGGESGGGARPFDPEWARSLVNQCRDAGPGETFPFVKQMGSRPVGLKLKDHHGGDMAEWPEDLRVREFPS